MLGIVLQWQIPLFDTAVWQIFKLHGQKTGGFIPTLTVILEAIYRPQFVCFLLLLFSFVLKEFQHNRIPPKLNLSTFGLFSNVFVSEYIKECISAVKLHL